MLNRAEFRDREQAGQVLAESLAHFRGRPDVLVLALPRGGVPVGYEVARTLEVPLDVFLVRKLGVPGHPELAMGAIATGGVRVMNPHVVRMAGVTPRQVEQAMEQEQRELERREEAYREGRPAPELSGRTVILVDDGLATGATMRAAARAVQMQAPARVVIAVPVAAAETCRELRPDVDELVCVATPEPFWGVGMWYQDFAQTSDDEVRDLLRRAEEALRAA